MGNIQGSIFKGQEATFHALQVESAAPRADPTEPSPAALPDALAGAAPVTEDQRTGGADEAECCGESRTWRAARREAWLVARRAARREAWLVAWRVARREAWLAAWREAWLAVERAARLAGDGCVAVEVPDAAAAAAAADDWVVESFAIGTLGCNCSLVYRRRSRQAIVIDPGDDPAALLAAVGTRNLVVTQLLHTHAHFDHIGGSDEIKRRLGVPILLHRDDEELYRRLQEQGLLFGVPVAAPGKVDRFIEEGYEVELGSRKLLTTIHTPGHSPGSCCFYTEITGRAAAVRGRHPVSPVGGAHRSARRRSLCPDQIDQAAAVPASAGGLRGAGTRPRHHPGGRAAHQSVSLTRWRTRWPQSLRRHGRSASAVTTVDY